MARRVYKSKDIAVLEENLIRAKIQRCKRERILPELIEGYQKPPGIPYDDYILKADKERLSQLEAELWDMHHRGVTDPDSDNIALRKRAYFRHKFLREMVTEQDTVYAQSAECIQTREKKFHEQEDEAAQHAGASSSTTTAPPQ